MNLTPKPLVYPRCPLEGCSAAYVLRRTTTFDGKRWDEEWVWQRDCKHKEEQPELVDNRKRRRKK